MPHQTQVKGQQDYIYFYELSTKHKPQRKLGSHQTVSLRERIHHHAHHHLVGAIHWLHYTVLL